MSILIGIGIVTTVTTFYLGRKGWQAFHKAVGISPGVLTYQDYNAPLSLATLSLQLKCAQPIDRLLTQILCGISNMDVVRL